LSREPREVWGARGELAGVSWTEDVPCLDRRLWPLPPPPLLFLLPARDLKAACTAKLQFRSVQHSTAQHSMPRRHMAQHSSIQVISSSETAKVSSNAAKAALEVNMPYSDGSHALKGHICN